MHERSRVRRCRAVGPVLSRFIAAPAPIGSLPPRPCPDLHSQFTRNLPRTPPPLSPRSLNPLIAGACLAALVALGTVPAAALAQAGGEIAERRSDLDELKQRIRELQEEMAKAETDRTNAQKALVESERAVSREVVDRILHETLSAPSARNTRTTRLVVVDDPVLVARMADMRDYGSAFMKGAPLADRKSVV